MFDDDGFITVDPLANDRMDPPDIIRKSTLDEFLLDNDPNPASGVSSWDEWFELVTVDHRYTILINDLVKELEEKGKFTNPIQVSGTKAIDNRVMFSVVLDGMQRLAAHRITGNDEIFYTIEGDNVDWSLEEFDIDNEEVVETVYMSTTSLLDERGRETDRVETNSGVFTIKDGMVTFTPLNPNNHDGGKVDYVLSQVDGTKSQATITVAPTS